jgi:hypothetical protein
MLIVLLACLGLLPAALAAAQENPGVDPRLAYPMIQALQAEVTLRDALLKALKEDQAKREAELAEWFKGWFGEDRPQAAK